MSCRLYKWAVLRVRASVAPRQAAPATTEPCVTPRAKLSTSVNATGQMLTNLQTLATLRQMLERDIADYASIQMQFEERGNNDQAAWMTFMENARSQKKGAPAMADMKRHLDNVRQENYILKRECERRMQAASNEMFDLILRKR
jgi:hypothetical protein